MEDDKQDIIIKIVIIGESSVGKSNLLLRYIKDDFDTSQRPTIGMDFITKEIETEEHRFKIQFWDTAGQEKYKSLASTYYKVAIGVILVYDVSNRETFEKLVNWMKDLNINSNTHSKILLIGNKTDLIEERLVSSQEGKDFAEKHEMFFWETSAKLNQGDFVNKAFDEIINECTKTVIAKEEAEMRQSIASIHLKTPTIAKKKKERGTSCC